MQSIYLLFKICNGMISSELHYILGKKGSALMLITLCNGINSYPWLCGMHSFYTKGVYRSLEIAYYY